MEPTYVSAFKGIGNNTMYVGSDGNIYEYSGGTPAWRDNNPGNIRAYKPAFDRGAIGTGKRPSVRLGLIFPCFRVLFAP